MTVMVLHAQPEPVPHPHPDLHSIERDAYDTLRRHGIVVTRVIRVSPDAILFVTTANRAMTAWLSRGAKELKVCCESGFATEPSAEVLQRLGTPPEYLRAADVPLPGSSD